MAEQLETGTYEIIRNRLEKQGKELQTRLGTLNAQRKEVFGAVDTQLIATERISTQNNCVPRDMIPVGEHFIFGYNVHLGLKAEASLEDVFSIYQYTSEDHTFHERDLKMLHQGSFEADFKQLYQYYKDTVFAKFHQQGPLLYMIFRVGKSVTDIKAFKWAMQGDGTLKYLDARSDSEVEYPSQHEFEWKRTNRDYHREGAHPHISIQDRLFVETIGGDLTIKVEDNTDSGEGIYAEPVAHAEQTLDDAEIYFADLGSLILLKMKPYQEKDFRYLVYNEKLKTVRRIDSIADSCVLLPDNQGILFSDGYYLQNGEGKQFETELSGMKFERRILSPNGEDVLFVFYHRLSGDYILLSYNSIEQQVETPIHCNGYSFFKNGQLIYFKTDSEPKKVHALQLWQTPYVHPDFELPVSNKENYLYKIGNKDIVRAMADCHEIWLLSQKENPYEGLYLDLTKKATYTLDAYYWINAEEAAQPGEAIAEIRDTAKTAIDEFEKVTRLKKHTATQTQEVLAEADAVIKEADYGIFQQIDQFVSALAAFRQARGKVIGLKELRYVDEANIAEYESLLEEKSTKLAQKCVEFLLRDDALDPYKSEVETHQTGLEKISTVTEASELEAAINGTANALELLIEIVGNLPIEDTTQSTEIIDRVSDIYASLNTVKAQLKNKRKELAGKEAVGEFNAQFKLLNQAVVNYLDVSDTPEKSEENLTRLMVQLEEMEGRFAEFDEFLNQIGEKREEVYQAFENRKISLQEALNKRVLQWQSAANRILKGIQGKVGQLKEITAINGYFAADLMVEKVRKIIKQLQEAGDSVKAADLQSQLKTLQEEAVRQLKDKQELYTEGENNIRLGRHLFSVNTQALEATIVQRDSQLFYHLTGTDFFEKVEDGTMQDSKSIWSQSILSENERVYRGEYLAYQLLKECQQNSGWFTENVTERLQQVQQFMATRYQEGYVKGVHDQDANLLIGQLWHLHQSLGLLRFSPETRATARLFWEGHLSENQRDKLNSRLKGMGIIRKAFPHSKAFAELQTGLEEMVGEFCRENRFCQSFISSKEKIFRQPQKGRKNETNLSQIATYLMAELAENDAFVISQPAADLFNRFQKHLKQKQLEKAFQTSLKGVEDNLEEKTEMLRYWLQAFASQEAEGLQAGYVSEAVTLLFSGKLDLAQVLSVAATVQVEGLSGDHAVISEGNYALDFHAFMQKMQQYEQEVVPQFNAFQETKKQLGDNFRKRIRLEEFQPRVLSSFVRNKLINEVYLPILGDNLAKQLGTAGENTRTDRMGMLLLISPPGYGKTTLMEYVSNRLGLVFMKINGPSIGHLVTSVDPAEAPNATAKAELEKLNLSFEMGNNVMIYLDDIQHCNPEFLQKFISLSDGQRKIEGVYNGVPRTYDLRGKKVCVVMAGNPYTESGDKFQIPDMLANRADTYNLGDILGDSEEAFKRSYIENALTSNPVLQPLSGKSQKDVHALIRIAQTGNQEGETFESNLSADEMQEYVSVLEKLLQVQETVLKVNQQYIHSASQSDDYRTEPAFKLQGSYRNMNKLAEKVVSLMNEQELQQLLLSHYEGESQTLTTGAEANLLKFKALMDWLKPEETARWEEILTVFRKNQKFKGIGSQDQIGQVLLQLSNVSDNLEGIKDALGGS